MSLCLSVYLTWRGCIFSVVLFNFVNLAPGIRIIIKFQEIYLFAYFIVKSILLSRAWAESS